MLAPRPENPCPCALDIHCCSHSSWRFPLPRKTIANWLHLIALNEILSLVAANKIKEAGEVAENSLGRSAMGKNARLPFAHRPGPQMPPAMHDIGRGGHFAASEFAAAAASGNRERALALLPNLTASCVGCHAAYRSR